MCTEKCILRHPPVNIGQKHVNVGPADGCASFLACALATKKNCGNKKTTTRNHKRNRSTNKKKMKEKEWKKGKMSNKSS